MVLQLAALLAAIGVGVAYLAAAPTPTAEECFARHGFPNAVIYPDGSAELPVLVSAGNAGQAWDAQADHAIDTCLP